MDMEMEVKFGFLECVKYSELEKAIEKLNGNEGEERFTLEDIGNEVIGEMLTMLKDKEKSDAIVSFVLSGASDEWIMRCIMVESNYSKDSKTHT